MSEKAARKDAAFQAYAGLHTTGLLNEHLLPLCEEWGPTAESDQLKSGQVEVSAQTDVWSAGGCALPETTPRYRTSIQLLNTGHHQKDVCLTMITYAPIPNIPSLDVGLCEDQKYHIDVAKSVSSAPLEPEELSLFRDVTMAIDRCGRSDRRNSPGMDLAVFIQPDGEDDVAYWLEKNCGSVPAEEFHKQVASTGVKVVRVPLPNRPPFVFHRWETNDQGQLCLACKPLKRHDDLKSPFYPDSGTESRTTSEDEKCLVFLASQCEIDLMDIDFVRLSMNMPRLFYHISDFTTAYQLRNEVLQGLPYSNLQYTVTAIRAPSSNRETNYQFLEFVGDTILKYVVSQFLYCSQPCWPEGFLTKRRIHLVCNERLAAEALKVGLDQYIITEPRQKRSWTLPSRPRQTNSHRTLPTKLLADVVEALIGATFLDTDGDLGAARQCVHRLIPAVPLAVKPFQPRPPISANTAANIVEAEHLIGRTFEQKTLLLEALTLSSGGSQLRVESYQRLEFLGDAVLDLIVVKHLICLRDNTEKLSQGELTRLRASLVNAHLLGYLNLHFRIVSRLPSVYTNPENGNFSVTTVESHLSLWQFLRHDSSDLTAAQQECGQRYQRLSIGLQDVIEHGSSYPWESLLALCPAKFYSDMVESIIGAIFVDSGGQLSPCEDFLTRIGFMGYMQRMVNEHIDVIHPRDRLQQLLGSRHMDYSIEKEGAQLFRGELTVDGVVRANVNGCLSKALGLAKLARMGVEWFIAESS